MSDQISKVNFSGGLPNSTDLAPSVVFLVAFVLTIPVLVWRLVSSYHRTTVLIRPAIFAVCRIAMLILRAIMSRNSYGETELIIELILASLGYLFLVEPTVQLWKRSFSSAISEHDDTPSWVRKVAFVLQGSILASIGTAIAASAQTSGALTDPDKMKTVQTLRKASSALALVVALVILIAVVLTHFRFGVDVRRTMYLMFNAVGLVIVSVYTVVRNESHDSSAFIRSKTAFWVLQVLFEFIVYIAFLSISIPAWFPAAEKASKDEDVESGYKMSSPRIDSSDSSHPLSLTQNRNATYTR